MIGALHRLLDAGLFISHDLSTVARVADTIAVVQNGGVAEHGLDRYRAAGAHHPYAEHLQKSVPNL